MILFVGREDEANVVFRSAVRDAQHMLDLPASACILGQVVDLACVEDPFEARLLSWAAGASSSGLNNDLSAVGCLMKALVVTSHKDAKRLDCLKQRRDVFYFPLDRLASARITEEAETNTTNSQG